MDTLKKLYGLYAATGAYDAPVEIPEITLAFEKIKTIIRSLDKDVRYDLDTLITEHGAANEMQGFIFGYRLAVRLMSECMGGDRA
jgi:hypothetical protein